MKTSIGITAVLIILAALFSTLAEAATAQQDFSKGFDLIKAGKLKEATTKFEHGLKAEPNNALAHFYLAEAYLGLKQNDKAKAHYQKSLKIDPTGPVAQDAKNRLEQLSSAKSLAVGSEFKDCDACPVMVVIPAGQFIMGSPPSEVGRGNDEGPPRLVKIAQPFAIGKFSVTRLQFAAFVNDTGYTAGNECYTGEGKRSGRNWRNPGYQQGDNHPAACINWDDAHAYAEWVSRKTGKPYHLPSEAEWEYAARADTRTARFWGESPDQACDYANVMDRTGKAQVPGVTGEVHNCTDGYAYTSPVGSFKPNAFGLYDMLGNILQWTEDCYHEYYAGAPADGSAWASSNDCTKRVLRGGSWSNGPRRARAAIRNWGKLTATRGSTIGFRLARTLP